MKSKKPQKKRKKYFQSKLHEIHKQLATHLSEKLRDTLKRRALSVRKNDVVRVMRGDYKGKQGKVVKVDYKKRQVFIDGITRKKTNGTEVLVPFNASNLLIVEIEGTDKKRIKTKKETKQRTEKTESKKGEN